MECAGLAAITLMYIYIFLTDAQHTVPKIKEEQEEKKEKEEIE